MECGNGDDRHKERVRTARRQRDASSHWGRLLQGCKWERGEWELSECLEKEGMRANADRGDNIIKRK